MTEQEFIDAILDKPWVNRADTVDACDCYGLVKLYYKMVVGFDLPIARGYKEGHRFDAIWRREIDKTWRQVGRWQKGAMVTFYDFANQPAHVGICVGNQQVLHSPGTEEKPGKVSIHKLSAIMTQFKFATYHGVVNA